MNQSEIKKLEEKIKDDFFDFGYIPPEELGYEVIHTGPELHTEWGGSTKIVVKFNGELHQFTFLRDSWNGEHQCNYDGRVYPVEITRTEYRRVE